MTKPKRTQILKDHKRYKKKLVPPLLAAMSGGFTPYSWARELVPEFLWITLLQRSLGLKGGTDFSLKMALTADRLCGHTPKPFFCRVTSFAELSESEIMALVDELSKSEDFAAAQKALSPLFQLLPESPLQFLSEGTDKVTETEATSVLEEVLPNIYDRYSRESALTMAGAVLIGFKQDKIKIMSEDTPVLAKSISDDFIAIENYPDTEESKMAAASLRAMAPMFVMAKQESATDKEEQWLNYFWDQVAGYGECVLEINPNFEEKVPDDPLGKIIFRFRNSARRELNDRIAQWKFDLNAIEQYEVIGALLARQTTLALDLAISPTIWTPDSAPLFLRAMADVFIALSWILKDPEKRSQQFIDDGLGRIKLEIEHRKQQLEAEGEGDPRSKAIIEYWERWMSSQRMDAFVEVNLGNWSGLNTRQMAEEAGCLDFYNYVYQPFSAAVHPTWPHVSDKNMQYCTNPAHRYHRVPVSIDREPATLWIVLAAKYLAKAFDKFDEVTGIQSKMPSAYAQLQDDLDNAEQQKNTTDESTA